MSGTSLDGLDLCLAQFEVANPTHYRILGTASFDFSVSLSDRLSKAHVVSGYELTVLSNDFAKFSAQCVSNFIETKQVEVDLIASHGHTVFHDPDHHLTLQIGSGAVIYAHTDIQTVCDFRSVDLALGGQGAPLVPIGDLMLFEAYDACLNLGGIANVSLKNAQGITAQDLCFANMIPNHICKERLGTPYDHAGATGSTGHVIDSLLRKWKDSTALLNDRSLAREDFEKNILSDLGSESTADLLRTAYEYTTDVIAHYLNAHHCQLVLTTGGGAHNDLVIRLLQTKTKSKLVLPNPELIDFKEALIFAFLGTLRFIETENVLCSVTKSAKNHIGGAVYGNKK